MSLQYSINLTPATGAVAIYNLFSWLIAQAWTVPQSSDGTTYLSSGNQITSGGAGTHGYGNNNAWALWQMPGSTKQFSIQRGATNQLWRVKYSPLNGFSGGTPGATQTPSATDEKIILGGGTDATPTFATLFAGADGSYRQEVVADVTAPYGFFSVTFPISSSSTDNCNHAFLFDPVVNTYVTDTDTYVVSASGNAHSLGSGIGAGGFFGIVSGTMQAINALIWPASVSSGSWAVDPVTGYDQFLPVVYYAPAVNLKGASTLLQWNTAGARITPTLLTDVTVNDSVQMGTCLLPWNGTGITI